MNASPECLRRLRAARSICVLTGAGVSAESGVPTFRGAQGIWAKFRPEELANMDAFLRDPKLVWEWYSMRRRVIREVKPNAGHLALAQLERSVEDFTLVTQNVDDLHGRACSKNVIELHGNIERNFCASCGADWKGGLASLELELPPECASCGGRIRPGVVWFGEQLPEGAYERAAEAARRCEVFLCAGTSAVVFPAASLPLLAREEGAFVIEVNAERTPISDRASEVLLGKSGEILPELVAARGSA